MKIKNKHLRRLMVGTCFTIVLTVMVIIVSYTALLISREPLWAAPPILIGWMYFVGLIFADELDWNDEGE